MALKILVICKNPENSNEASLCKILDKEFEVSYSWKNTLTKSELDDIEIIIAIGGDGTVLSASHFVKDKPLLAVNSSPGKSVGALTTISLNELPKKLEQLKEKIETENLERMEIVINDKSLEPLALNDIFIGNERPYHPSKYEISFNNKKEKQLSSGLIFSTGTGSSAWFKSAGGKPFSPQSRFIKMIVREPYRSKLSNPSMLNCEIKEGEEIEISPIVSSILVVDSIREFKLKAGDRVKIRISKHPLKRII